MIGILWYRERAKHPIEYFHTRSVYFYLSVKIQALGFHALGYGNWMFGDSWSCVFFGADSFGCRTFLFCAKGEVI